MLCIKAMSAKSIHAVHYTFFQRSGTQTLYDGCIISQRFALHVYLFAFLLKMIVAETAAHLHSFTFTKANLLLKNRAICEQKDNSTFLQGVLSD